MKVSVIIPVYNRADILKTAIESIFCQSYKNIEIIVVDDGSILPVKNFIQPYLNRIRLIELSQNKGVSFARNVGIKESQGEYIAFLDSDDIWLPFKLKLQMDFINKSGLSIVHTDEFWWKKGKFVNQGKRHKKYGGEIFEKILDTCRISPSSVLIKKNVFKKIGLFDEKFRACEDYDLWLRMALNYEIGYMPIKTIVKRFFLDDHLSMNVRHLEYLRLLSLCKFVSKNGKICFKKKIAAYREIDRKFLIVCKGVNKK